MRNKWDKSESFKNEIIILLESHKQSDFCGFGLVTVLVHTNAMRTYNMQANDKNVTTCSHSIGVYS